MRWRKYSGMVGGRELIFEREYDFAPVIVWDALLDSELVSGWLAEAAIEPVLGGEYNLRWVNRTALALSVGRITLLKPAELLQVETTSVGRWRFDLAEFEGGNRGTRTRVVLRVTSDVDPAFEARVKADWHTNLDQLDDLLHGHPVDWANWDRDRHEAWARHFDDAANSAS
ncbi:MAG: SRPBCC domain-containing protein [Salinibacterium sp.]|nr:SRPBCC domain-containing protein [Salinibacterium sp.]